MSTLDLFEDLPPAEDAGQSTIAPGAFVLHGFGLACDAAVLQAIEALLVQVPLRHMVTPGGHTMSVAMSNCGELGWVSDVSGYRYNTCDPCTGRPLPAMPGCCLELAQRAAAQAGYQQFQPNACLVNEYVPGAKLSLHQDKDELNFSAPIVSLSLGLSATFLFSTTHRKDRPKRHRLVHGDVVVWGGPSRLAYHGVMALADGVHPMLGHRRLNLTFRCVG